MDDCSDRDGCKIAVAYNPQTKKLTPSELPVLIPGDRLTVRVLGNLQKPRGLGAWDCVWWRTEGFIITKKVRRSRTVRPVGMLGQQIRLAALLEDPAGQSEKLGEFSARQVGLPERVILGRQRLQLAGTVSLSPTKPTHDSDCSMTEQPPGGTWYEVQVRIVRAGR